MREALLKRLEPHWVQGYWFSIDVGDGWLPIVENLFDELCAVEPGLEIYQIKEKFGGLRFYCKPVTDAVLHMIDEAASIAAVTCDVCGSSGELGRGGYWISTRCADHRPAGWQPVNMSVT